MTAETRRRRPSHKRITSLSVGVMDRPPCDSARGWAATAPAGSATAKLILILLADKADGVGASSSCAPSLRTLVAESGAGRSTVLRALKELEARGLITRQPQFDADGARLPTRYHLNHRSAQPVSTADTDAAPPAAPSSGPALPTAPSPVAADSRWDTLPLLLGLPDAARLLGISKAMAYRWAARGDLPTRRLGSRVYIQTDRLRHLLEVPRAAFAAPAS